MHWNECDQAVVPQLKRCYIINWLLLTALWIWFQSWLGIPLRLWKLPAIPLAPVLSFVFQNQSSWLFLEREKRKKKLQVTPQTGGLSSQNCKLALEKKKKTLFGYQCSLRDQNFHHVVWWLPAIESRLRMQAWRLSLQIAKCMQIS